MDTVIQASLNAAMKALQAGVPADAAEAARAALDRATEAGLAEEEMLAAGLLAPALAQLGDLDDAAVWAERARQIAAEREDGASEAHYQGQGEQVARLRARRDQAAMPLSEAEIEAALDRAANALTRKKPGEAMALLSPLVEAMSARELLAVEASARGMLAQALVMDGRAAEAIEHVERALAIAEDVGQDAAAGHFRGLLASLQAPDEADAEQAIEKARLAELAGQAMDEAAKAIEDERYTDAVAALTPVADQARDADAASVEASARGTMAQALLLAGDRAAAAREVERALELATALGEDEAVAGFTQLLALATGWKPEVGEA